tara:strand:- start:79 stop:420 length:342 start_codon:yes stop_codon:yes gene_type:complete
MVDLKSLGYIAIIDIIIKIIFDSVYTLKIIKEICRDKSLNEFIGSLFTMGPLLGSIVALKLVVNIIVFIVCLFIFGFNLFSLNSLLTFVILVLNEIISRKIIYESHICEELTS